MASTPLQKAALLSVQAPHPNLLLSRRSATRGVESRRGRPMIHWSERTPRKRAHGGRGACNREAGLAAFAAWAEFAGDGVAAQAQACGGFGAAALGELQGSFE